jgi:hypothetical protein
VTITILATISTIAAGLIRTLLRTERQGVAHVNQLSNLSRLSRQFRTDAHAASKCEAVKGSDTDVVQLTLPSQETVIYSRHDRGVTRTQQKEGRVIHRNMFRLSDVQLRFQRAGDEAAIVTLVIGLLLPDASKEKGAKAIGVSPNDRSPREFRVDARLGCNVVMPAPLAPQGAATNPN